MGAAMGASPWVVVYHSRSDRSSFMSKSDEILDAVQLLIEEGFIVVKKDQIITEIIEVIKQQYPPAATPEEASKTANIYELAAMMEGVFENIPQINIFLLFRNAGYITTGSSDGVSFLIK